MKKIETGSEWNKEDDELAEQLAHFIDNMGNIINQIAGRLFEQYPLINNKNIDFLLLVKCNHLYSRKSSNRSLDRQILLAALGELADKENENNRENKEDDLIRVNSMDIKVDSIKH